VKIRFINLFPEHSMDSSEAEHLINRLLKKPKLFARFGDILDITENVDGRCKTADEVEERAIEELRKRGNEVLHSWADTEAEVHDSSVDQRTHRRKIKKNSTGKAVLER
jgi:hypothetical protein